MDDGVANSTDHSGWSSDVYLEMLIMLDMKACGWCVKNKIKSISKNVQQYLPGSGIPNT